MRQKISFSASAQPLGGLVLAAICTASILTPANGQIWGQASPANSPSARSHHAIAYDAAHGQVVLFGGYNSGLLGDTWVWDGTNWTQKSPSTSPPSRFGHAMAYDSAHAQVVLFGGFDSSNYLGDTWVWDGTNWAQKSPSTSPPARWFHAMTYDAAHGQVVLFGGTNGGALGDTWVWDGTNWTQKSPSTSPPARNGHAMAYDSVHAQTVLFGGYNGSALGDTWVWDGTNWTQKSGSISPPARFYHAMAYDVAHGQVVLFGGFSGSSTLGDTWVWGGTNWNPESPASSPSARELAAMAYDAVHGQVVLFGGYNGSYLGDTWLWYRSSFANWAQTSPANSPSARYAQAMAYDSLHGQVVLFGGYDGSNVFGDTWVWDGTNWTQKTPSTSPPARYLHAMAYDAAHGQVVLFGGFGGGFFGDTWVWDGTNWTHKSPSTSPPARDSQAMAYDSAHGQVVLFGGRNFNNTLGDTWVWDGTNWTQKSPGMSRWGHAMAYDSAHGQVVLFGGYNVNSGGYLGDTWVWDGTNWTLKSPSTSPPARDSQAMAYDALHGQVVLFGGYNGNSGPYLGDTWVWDGTNWTQKPSSTSPPPRSGHAMAYDTAHAQVVLFGGGFGVGLFSDTWVWQGGFSVSPNSGSGSGPQVFAATYFDNNGVSDLQVVYLDFGATGDAPHDCKVAYAPAGHTLYLFNDANNGVVGAIVLGGGSSLSNSQCTLFGGNNAAVISGNQLTVPFDIQFLGGYGGRKTIWGVAQNFNGVQSDGGVFESLGTWTPAASTPNVVSVNPSTGNGGGPQTFTAIYSDTGGANDLQAVYLDFGSVGFAAHNCIVVYVPGPNQLYLFTDDNSSAFGPIAEGSGSGSVSNSQCKLFSGSTAASVSGNNLTVPFTIQFLNGYGGKKTIFGLAQTYAGVQSNGGVLTSLGSWEPATTTPAAVSVNPNSGSGLGQTTFTAGYSDTGGANDLQVVYLSFGSSFLAANSCNVGYEPGNNTLLLFSDDNSTAATVGEGLGGSVSNSQCTLSGGGTAASMAGNGLTVPFTITFTNTFTGAKTIFGLAQTYDGTQSAVTNLGSWTPAP
jgi:hypothetical protein